VFGSICYAIVLNEIRTKLDDKALKGLYMGRGTTEMKVYLLDSGKLVEVRTTQVQEGSFLSDSETSDYQVNRSPDDAFSSKLDEDFKNEDTQTNNCYERRGSREYLTEQLTTNGRNLVQEISKTDQIMSESPPKEMDQAVADEEQMEGYLSRGTALGVTKERLQKRLYLKSEFKLNLRTWISMYK
jgi:hypothetical protein